jgi:hypothetical protein
MSWEASASASEFSLPASTSDILRSVNGGAGHELVDKLVSQSLTAANRQVPLAGNRSSQGTN